ncbi:MAG TPA: Gfo/Idh/MocA family oxidoreductase, partial [Candidatus Hydrogenedentes bacterium]|nr:Gfo/Idh/MocA family oxidoreductase [Candidatus Hydrogenedentota bacterium]
MKNGGELRIGVIGAGGRGALAAHAHKPDDGVRLVAGADVRPEPLERFKEAYGAGVFVTTDYRELLNRDAIEAVFVTSPDYHHEEQAETAQKTGKKIKNEKHKKNKNKDKKRKHKT